MIIKTDGEMEAFRLGISIGARLPMRVVRSLYPGSLPFDTAAPRPLPWVKNASTSINPDVNVPSDAPPSSGLRQPIGADPTDAALDQS